MDGPETVCSRFEPQRWRETKCKNCFEDIKLHNNENEEESASKAVLSLTEEDAISSCVQQSSEQRNDDGQNIQDKDRLHQDSVGKFEDLASKSVEDDVERGKYSAPCFETTRKLSYENGSLLSKFSAVEFSSCSSLASYDALEDTTLSSYSYSGSRENLDGFISGEEIGFAETGMENEKNLMADTTEQMVNVLEEQIESLRESHKAMEMNKDKQIQALDREIQNLKLELAKYSARENMSILKKRLEIEGKNIRIEELENEVKHFETTIESLNESKYSDEFQQDVLAEDLKRRNNRIQNLEEEKRTLEERLSLAEDLQQNDRELLEVLRSQLTSLEKDLLSSEDKNKQLEERVKSLSSIEEDLKDERLNLQKLNKQIDFLNGKLRLREQHVSYLEDDNVSLNQQNNDLESKLKKSLVKNDKLKNTIKDLENDVEVYNKEIERLNAENSELEHGHWQAIIEQADASGEVQNYIQDLEKRVAIGEGKIRDLEYENEAVLKESGELLDNLVEVRADYDEMKSKLESLTEKYDHMIQVKNDQDKRTILLQRKVKKLQKEKKRCQTEKTDAESKISELRSNNSKLSVKCDEIEKGYKMIQLKLQSTEAKLTMLEGNKVYLEAKVDEFEKKFNASQNKLITLNKLVNDSGFEGREGIVKQEEFNFDLLELKLKDISNKSKSKTMSEESSKMEYQSNVSKDGKEKTFLKSHPDGQEGLQRSLSAREKGHLNDICDYFEVHLKQLKEQNEVLESELHEVHELQSSFDYVHSVPYGTNVGPYGRDVGPYGTDVVSAVTNFTNSGTDVTHSGTNVTHSGTGVTNSSTDVTHSGTDVTSYARDVTHSGRGVAHSGPDVTHFGTDGTHSNTDITHSSTDITCSGTDVTHSGTDATHCSTYVTHSGTDVTHSGTDVTHLGTDFTPSARDIGPFGTELNSIGTDFSHAGKNFSRADTNLNHNINSLHQYNRIDTAKVGQQVTILYEIDNPELLKESQGSVLGLTQDVDSTLKRDKSEGKGCLGSFSNEVEEMLSGLTDLASSNSGKEKIYDNDVRQYVEHKADLDVDTGDPSGTCSDNYEKLACSMDMDDKLLQESVDLDKENSGLIIGDLSVNLEDKNDLPNDKDLAACITDEHADKRSVDSMPMPNGDASFTQILDGYADSLAHWVLVKAAADTGMDKLRVNSNESRHEMIIDNVDVNGSADIQGENMESERPVTSVRCIFEILPDIQVKSSLAHPEDAKNTSLRDTHSPKKSATFPRTKAKATNHNEKEAIHDKRWSELANERYLSDKNHDIVREHSATPHYTVAASQLRHPEKDLDADSGKAKKESVTLKDRPISAGTSDSFRVSQESSGAITLTIPTACLSDSDSAADSEGDIADIPSSKADQSKPSTLPEVTLILKNPSLESSEHETGKHTNTEKKK